MRIISGIYKSRKIHSGISSKGYRPSSDRTRETLFNILTHRIDLQGASCLDLFAGSGAYGFEALSRGASKCDFVEKSSSAIPLIRKTSEELGCENRTAIIKSDALEYLREDDNSNHDIIFADPPYEYPHYMELFRLVLLKKFKVFVLECSKQTLKALSNDTPIYKNKFTIIDKIIGRTCLRIFITTH